MTALVIVNYRTAQLAVRAAASARAASSQPLRVIIVDNSEDPAEAERLRGAADELIVAETNLGYGRAVNLARSRIADAAFIVSNPDVVFGPGSIDLLIDELAAGAAVAGPALHWDEAFTWILPPSYEHRLGEKVHEVLASRSSTANALLDRMRVRARVAFWQLDDVTDVTTISGAVMAFRTDAFDAAGGFDERFWLYFEETDLLRRIRSSGGAIRYVPDAKVRHLFNQSAAQASQRAAAAYDESETLYHGKWDGRRRFELVKRFERPPRTLRAKSAPLIVAREGLFVEVSPVASFSVAAGRIATQGRVLLPDDVRQTLGGQTVYGRTIAPESLRTGPVHVIATA